MNEQQAAFLRQWYAAWQEHQKRVAALEERLARLEEKTANIGADVEQLWVDCIERKGRA